MTKQLEPGTLVGAKRWPYDAAHPDCWGTPWSGTVLGIKDPQAWAHTMAFPVAHPEPRKVAEHVAWCQAQGFAMTVPVLWDFGASGKVVYWERPESLRPYGEDYMAWVAARQKAREVLSTQQCAAATPKVNHSA